MNSHPFCLQIIIYKMFMRDISIFFAMAKRNCARVLIYLDHQIASKHLFRTVGTKCTNIECQYSRKTQKMNVISEILIKLLYREGLIRGIDNDTPVIGPNR